MDDAVGPVAEASMVFGILSAGLRYTYMENTVAGVAEPMAASSVGLFLGLTHPR